jgi:hypothetical protein
MIVSGAIGDGPTLVAYPRTNLAGLLDWLGENQQRRGAAQPPVDVRSHVEAAVAQPATGPTVVAGRRATRLQNSLSQRPWRARRFP